MLLIFLVFEQKVNIIIFDGTGEKIPVFTGMTLRGRIGGFNLTGEHSIKCVNESFIKEFV
jgi:hypothetical protein